MVHVLKDKVVVVPVDEGNHPALGMSDAFLVVVHMTGPCGHS